MKMNKEKEEKMGKYELAFNRRCIPKGDDKNGIKGHYKRGTH